MRHQEQLVSLWEEVCLWRGWPKPEAMSLPKRWDTGSVQAQYSLHLPGGKVPIRLVTLTELVVSAEPGDVQGAARSALLVRQECSGLQKATSLWSSSANTGRGKKVEGRACLAQEGGHWEVSGLLLPCPQESSIPRRPLVLLFIHGIPKEEEEGKKLTTPA